ncbi:MAG: valine--tRNA ligase [Verrucomicrobia bacterium]|nr:valine--tRNA ligase [Verrucomicrobiota bacterium]
MTVREIPKAYEAKLVEDRWYQTWLKQGVFTADPKSPKRAYCIVIPPPNVTGVLTMGHVLNNTLQDILCRRKRMQGFEVLWLPGTDHAGIATQTVVEKTLRKQGIRHPRRDLGREGLVAKIWEWKEKHGGIIIQQLKKLGCSCDWSRERFTMDEGYTKSVLHAFVALYKKGLIYRGKRMVNWCPVSQTTLSDEEVIMKEVESELWHFKYPLLDAHGKPHPKDFLVVATTRPETMLGDEAVAVHPNDARYKHLVGHKCLLPIQNKQIPVIADEAVDPKFGTGCVKVTPSHDPADYEMALRHNLPFTEVIGPDGRMTELAGEDFAGMDRLECREAVVEQMRTNGLMLKTEPYKHSVGYSERADVPIEPRVSEQWFLKYPQVKKSLAAVEQGEIKFYPERWTKTYAHWMKNIRDWAISRQLWWGHRIPVWYRKVGQASGLPTSVERASGSLSNEDRKPEACATEHFRGLDPFAEVDVSRRRLPHWRQAGATYFVTFRLADSIPEGRLAELEAERQRWLANHSEPLSEADHREYYQLFNDRVEQWLDEGHGSCVLSDVRAAKIVAGALRHFDGQRYMLGAWVVMPNHVHVLVTPREGQELGDILHSWKSFSAHEINKLTGRAGQLWQHESHDHIVRDAQALARIQAYIEQNPQMARVKGLVGQASGLSTGVEQASGLLSTEDRKPEACATIYVGAEPPPDPENWEQDPDVLDTWASSWLWPFATMGRWPEEKSDTLAKFYPTTDLVTGPDIIFFWVARMIMAGYEFMGQKPFSNVYFTGIIRDAIGRKMSKSLGNSPDPLDLVARFGADGLRFGLMLIAPQGSDILFAEERIEVGRNFCNKLWNAARLRQMQGNVAQASSLRTDLLTSDDHYILAKLDDCIRDVSASLDVYKFNEAAQTIFQFFWREYCDWYLEVSKSALQGADAALKANVCAVMDTTLSNVLRLLHPYAPFITEELWHGLGFTHHSSLITHHETIQFAPWPSPLGFGDAGVVDWVSKKYALVVAGRNLRAEKKIAPGKKANFKIKAASPDIAARLQKELASLRILLNAEQVEFVPATFQPPPGMPAGVGELGSIFMLLEGLVDAAAERRRIEAQLAKLAAEIEAIDSKLADANFTAKAKPAAVEQQRARRAEKLRRQAELQKLLT